MPVESALERLTKCARHGWSATLHRDQCAEIARQRRHWTSERGMPVPVWARIHAAFMQRRGARLSVDEVKMLHLPVTR